MKSIKQVFFICQQNFRKWSSDYRIWVVGILLLVLVFENVRNYADIAEGLGVKSSLWIFPFLYSQYHMKLIFTLPLLIIFCNAPFSDRNTLFVLVRSGRTKWIIGQMLYIVISAAVYYVFVFLCSILLSLPYAELTNEWGKLMNTIAYTGAATMFNHNFIDVSGFVLSYFIPIQAVWFTFVLSWLTAVMLGMIICVFNIITNTSYIGCGVASVIIVFSCYVAAFGGDKLLPYSPVSWNTLNNIDVGGYTNNPSFYYCVVVCVGISATLAAITALFTRKNTTDR